MISKPNKYYFTPTLDSCPGKKCVRIVFIKMIYEIVFLLQILFINLSVDYNVVRKMLLEEKKMIKYLK